MVLTFRMKGKRMRTVYTPHSLIVNVAAPQRVALVFFFDFLIARNKNFLRVAPY